MYLWKISQDQNNNYDTFDSAIVAAANETEARGIHPSGDQSDWNDTYNDSWVTDPGVVSVEQIGVAKPGTPAGVVLASFNAG